MVYIGFGLYAAQQAGNGNKREKNNVSGRVDCNRIGIGCGGKGWLLLSLSPLTLRRHLFSLSLLTLRPKMLEKAAAP